MSYRALGYVRLHFVTWRQAPRNAERAHNTSQLSQQNTKQTRRKLISFLKMSIERLLSSPAWRGLQPFLWLLQVFFLPGLSLFKMQTLQPLAAQQGICFSPCSLWGKGLWLCFFLLFTEALFALGIFPSYVNIAEEIIWDLRKGVGERELWGRGFKAGSSVPCRTHHLNKAPFLGRELFFNSELQGEKKGFFGEKDRISLTAVKKNHNFLLFLFLKASLGSSVQHFELSSLKFFTHLRFLYHGFKKKLFDLV